MEDQSDEGDFVLAKHRTFTYFLTKYYSNPGVASLKSLRVVIANVEMDAKVLFNKIFLLSFHAVSEEARVTKYCSYKTVYFLLTL